jgi:hypothetical protein
MKLEISMSKQCSPGVLITESDYLSTKVSLRKLEAALKALGEVPIERVLQGVRFYLSDLDVLLEGYEYKIEIVERMTYSVKRLSYEWLGKQG